MKDPSGPPTRIPLAVGGATFIITGAAVSMWLLFDVPVDVVLRYLGYEFAFTAGPGILAWHAIVAPARTGVKEIALGWAFGYVLELVAFSATAAVGARSVFIAYPVLVAGVCGLVWWRRHSSAVESESGELLAANPSGRREGRTESHEGAGWMWAFGILVAILLAYVAERYFTGLPLPGKLTGPVDYYLDYVWQMSVAAEARNHWPLEVPNVVGLKLEYHYFAYLHMAAVNQVTGIDLATVDFRLYIFPIVVAVSLLLVALGRSLTGSAWVGLIAVFLAFVVGRFDPFPQAFPEYFTQVFAAVYGSASFGYGLLFFLPIAILLGDQLRSKRLGSLRDWILVGVFAAAAGGSKATILPDVLAALVIVGLVALWLERKAPLREHLLTARVALGAAIIGSIGLLSKLVLFPGETGAVEIQPLDVVRDLFPARLFVDRVAAPDVVDAVVLVASAVPLTIKMLAPLLPGLVLLFASRENRRSIASLWPLALLLSGLAIYYVTVAPGASQLYFLYYGYVAGAAISAVGLWRFWEARFAHVRIRPALGLLFVGAILLPWVVAGPPGGTGPPLGYQYLTGSVTWSTANSNLTPDLYHGYRWIRNNTPTDSVLATNNRWLDPEMTDPRYFYASAFAERRVLLEGEYGTPYYFQFATARQLRRDPSAGPYSKRARLIQSIFDEGSRSAVRTARREYGVDYLVLDLVHKGAARPARVVSLGDVVHRNRAMIVVDVR